MSGFGGGFGNNNSGFGGGFGQSPAAPFGSPPAAAPAAFGSPFGGFGSNNNATTPTAFAAPASFAGNSTPMNSTGGFGSSNNTGFGGGGFGAPSPGPGFGGGGFGNSNNNSGFGSPFGSAAPPSSSNNNESMMDVPNPFGSSTGAPSPAVTFGSSSNVAMSNAPAPSMGFGGFGGGAPFGSNNNNSNNNNPNPFGGGPPSGGMTIGAPASHQRSNSVEMGGSDSPTPMSSGAFGSSSSPFATGGNLSPIPEDTMGDANSSNPFGGNNNSSSSSTSGFGSGGGSGGFGGSGFGQQAQQQQAMKEGGGEKEQELAKLKARLEAKKKKLMEKQKKKEEASSSNNNSNNNQGQGQTQPQGQGRGSDRKQPRDRDNRDSRDKRNRNDRSRSSSPAPQLDDEQKARAERNAARFATNTQNSATQSFIPSELRGQTAQPSSSTSAAAAPSSNKPKASVTSAVGGEANREDLANAKSLVGTCQYMCPDEELLRRERENDIQLLELPDPGGTHPQGWTLRNTAVKRFRRSAADYKLDVPEWVRPPDVLEQVCSYLEEWVMERDRQGPDRRFPQNGTPSSMDLYQFIWDRTRMIRKDFILQNFVGTGGACDARAVRCHERIARWHAMCEHQLSHINDFVVKQSQQNIQELGQAMKTLNQYYDDSLGRAVVEVPDEEGRETRPNPIQFEHGCKANAVQGVNPVDYDGSPLNNTADVTKLPAQRLIGKEGANSPTRGTAEPEMRGLYILLTMNNDGGMEVMNYSAILYRERPEIYHSKPVQLALDIFKAKKDYNYIRFFRLLKDPNTPYLFSCLMFKHVEYFRKIAFRIMSKTYGAKKNGEPIYDAYPLKRLAHVLCFEDMDEARAACKHYNITVKEVKVRSSSSGQTGLTEVVFWRHSDFKEPKDPVKGHTLPLRPKKMIRYIESKLKGATRLGVCRGEVSGAGAALSQLPPSRVPQVAPPGSVKAQSQSTPAVSVHPSSAPSMLPTAPSPVADEAAQANDLLKAQQEILRKQKEEEARKKMEEKKRKEEERKKAEQLRLAQEEEKRLEQRRRRKEQEELMKRKQEEKKKQEEERMRKEAEAKLRAQKEKEEREHAEAAAREAARLKAEEEKRQRLEEEARLKGEAEAREQERLEKLRQEEERRKREILAEKNRQRLAELERIRQEEERKRLEELRAQEEERKRLEAIERQKAKELEERVNFARKLLLVRRFRQKLPREFISRSRTQESIKQIDPTFCVASSPFSGDVMELELAVAKSASLPGIEPDCRKILNHILSKETLPLDVASMMLSALCKDDDLMERVRSKKYRRKESGCAKATFFVKVAVILPDPEGLEEQSMYEAIHTWLNRRLEYGQIDTVERTDASGELSAEVRVLFVKADSWSGPANCDVALIVVPPALCSGNWGCSRKVDAISAAFNCVDPSTPRVALVLGESFDSEYHANVKRFLAACIPTNAEEFPVVFPNALSETALEGSLESSLTSLIKVFSLEYPPLVEQVSVMRMASKCISDTLWVDLRTPFLESAFIALAELKKELEDSGQEVANVWSNWPADDFAGQRGLVREYFGEGVHLPTSWSSLVFQDVGKNFISELQQSLQAGSVAEAIGPMLAQAPFRIQQECDAILEQRHYRKYLQRALEYVASKDETTIYLPMGRADEIVDESIKRVMENTGVPLPLNREEDEEDDDLEDENIRPPPTPAIDVTETAIDDAGVFQKARDIFEISRTISPVPPGGGSMTLTPSPNYNNNRTAGTVSPPPGVSSAGAKRSWVGMAIADREEENGLLSPLRSPSPHGSGMAAKRSRDASYSRSRPTRSRDQIESSAYTKKLQALLTGEATVDMDVGTTSLSRLVRDTPLLDHAGRSSGVEEIL